MYQSALRLHERPRQQKALDCGRSRRRSSQADIYSLFRGLRAVADCPYSENRQGNHADYPFSADRQSNEKYAAGQSVQLEGDTVADILERPEYQGHTVNFKTYKQSYKSKKTCYNPKEKQLVFENTHEAIIDADTWERVQELRKNKRRPTRTGKTNLFSGIVRCADCGEKLYYCTSKNFEARQDHFVCSTSRLKGKEVCPTHFVRAVVLEQGVLAHMRLVIACVSTHEERFRKAMGAKQKAEAKKELAAKRRQLTQAERRIEELDRLFKSIYEDNASGKLSDSRFQMLSDDYEQEQEELREKLLQLNEEIIQQEEQAENIDRFIGKVRKYLDLDELMPTVLNDMVKAVYVHAPDKSSGHREQQIDISYDLVGMLPASLLGDLSNGETA